MPRYEFVDGASKKFWEIALEGTSFTTTYGRIGTDGQMSMKEWDDEDKAKKEYDKLVAEKTKKGYELVSGDDDEDEDEAPKKKAPAAAKSSPKAAPSKPAAKTKGKAAVFDDEGDDDEEEDEDEAPKKKAPAKAAAKAAPAKAAPAKSGSAKKGARYFEFVDGGSSKFWEIELDGASFTTRYGKIGTDGQISMQEWDDEEKSKKEYDKLVAEKTKKGYEEK